MFVTKACLSHHSISSLTRCFITAYAITMAQKRPSSPLPVQNCKRALLSDDSDSILSGNSQDTMILQEALAKQVELVQNLVFKDAECQKLKKKFDDVNRNCRKWHDFAINLQAKVKRLVLIMHRNQESMNILRNKGAHMTETAVQTDCSIFSPIQSSNYPAFKTGEKAKGEHVISDCGKNSALLQGVGKLKRDLTEEENMNKLCISATKTVETSTATQVHHNIGSVDGKSFQSMRGPEHGMCDFNRNRLQRPLAPVQLVDASFAVLSCSSPKGKDSSRKAQIGSLKDKILTPSLFASQVRDDEHLAPYSPLRSMPLPSPSLPKSISTLPPQPILSIRKSEDNMVLSWNHDTAPYQATVVSYELFICKQNSSNYGPNRWKKLGKDPIKAVPLPMGCCLRPLSSGSKHYFAVRGKDVYGRYGAFSAPCCTTDVQ